MKQSNSKKQMLPFLVIPGLVALWGFTNPLPKETTPAVQPVQSCGYTFSCWLNGWRKHKADQSPEILAIQASAYDFTLNLADFSKAGFDLTSTKPQSYADALKSGTDAWFNLPPADILITSDVNGEQYRAVSCAAGTDPDLRRLGAAKMWESGRFVQHFELVDLKFKNATGKALDCKGDLTLVAWPDSLTLTYNLPLDNKTTSTWRLKSNCVSLPGAERLGE